MPRRAMGGGGGGGGEVTAGGRPFTMRFRHRNEEMAWERAQRSTLTNWMNYILKKFLSLFFHRETEN
jgi:hypothetical protein